MTATRSEDGRTVVMHIVNTSSADIPVEIDMRNAGKTVNIRRLSLYGDLTDTNTPHEPEKIVPRESKPDGMRMTLEARSYTVLEVSCDVLDDIRGITSDDGGDSVYYNVSGQSVSSPQRGIYIKEDGRKVIM